MSRAFAKKKSTFYMGQTGYRLRRLKTTKTVAKDALLLADYLISGPMANHYGLYQLEIETVVNHLPMTEAEAVVAFAALHDEGFAHYDEATRWVWVAEMAEHQMDLPLKPQDNLVKGGKRWYLALPRSCPWMAGFYDRYAVGLCFDIDGERCGPAIAKREGASEGLVRGSIEPRSPSPSPSPVLSSPEGGEGGNPEFMLAPPSTGPKPKPDITWRVEAFDRLYATYPKPTDRKKALEHYVKVVKTPEKAAEVQDGLDRQKPFLDYSDDLKWIVTLWRWIDRERWKDEVRPHSETMSARTQATAKTVARAAQRGAPK